VPSIARLTEIGVKRISVEGGMMRLAFREIGRELDRPRQADKGSYWNIHEVWRDEILSREPA
jgi:hypothetical protein